MAGNNGKRYMEPQLVNGRRRDKRQKFRQTLSSTSIRLMMMGLLRFEPAFLKAKDLLTSDMLKTRSDEYAVLWAVLLGYYEKHSKLPNRKLLMAELRTVLADDDGDSAVDADGDAIRTFIGKAFEWAVPAEEVTNFTDWVIATVSQFLEEVLVQEAKALVDHEAVIPENTGSLLAELSHRFETARSLQESTTDALFPEDWSVEGLKLERTGCPFIDFPLGGGVAGGELIGLLGAYGSCKTTLAVQMSVEGAREEMKRRRTRKWDGITRLSFLFYWESGHPDEFRFRSLSCAAEILRDRLEKVTSFDQLSKWPKLEEYEKELFDHQLEFGERVRGEQERVNIWRPLLNEYLCYVDMTGYDKRAPGRGAGGIPEIARIIESKLRGNPKLGVRAVYLDYIGAMVDRQMQAEKADDSSMRHYIRRAMLGAKNDIGKRFSCPVFALHQLKAEANARKPGSIARRTDAAEAGNFSEHCDFCLEAGLPTADGLVVLNCDKHRRQKNHGFQILQIRGEFARVEPTNGRYALDGVTKQIVAAHELRKLHEGHVKSNKEYKVGSFGI